jgi:hypothetical protein
VSIEYEQYLDYSIVLHRQHKKNLTGFYTAVRFIYAVNIAFFRECGGVFPAKGGILFAHL